MYTCITTKDRREVQCVNIVERPGVFEVKDTFQKEKINECIETCVMKPYWTRVLTDSRREPIHLIYLLKCTYHT